MTRVESFNILVPSIDTLNQMINVFIKKEGLDTKDVNLVLELIKARTMVECAGSLAIIADSMGIGPEDIAKKFSDLLLEGEEDGEGRNEV